MNTPKVRRRSSVLQVCVYPEERIEFLAFTNMLKREATYKGEPPGAVGRWFASHVRRDSKRVRASLLNMGVDPDRVLAGMSQPPRVDEPGYGRADGVVVDPE